MSYVGSWKIDDLLTFYAITTRFDTGAATDADAAPSYRVYEDEASTPLLTGSMALLDSANTAGFYSEQITLSAANGFEKGKCYAIYISATVNSVVGAAHRTFQIEAEVDANTVSAPVTVGTNNDKTDYGLSAASVAAIWAAATRTLTSLAGAELSAAGVDAILDEVIEGAVTLRESMRLANAANGGKTDGLATTTVHLRDLADSKNRVTATVDADGNRSSVTRDLS